MVHSGLNTSLPSLYFAETKTVLNMLLLFPLAVRYLSLGALFPAEALTLSARSIMPLTEEMIHMIYS